MSKFYGQVFGQAKTVGTRRGSKEIKVSAQSWDGSVITQLKYSDGGDLIVDIDLSDCSSCYGSYNLPRFSGTFDELVEIFRKAKK